MANITRIKNNQITDSTIEYTKIKPGTLTGSVFNPNLTFNSNITVLGNLSVTGTSATINSTDTYVNDPLIVFNNGYVGSPSYDIGIVANRNLGSLAPYGSVNTAFVWSESDNAWIAIATTETGGTKGSLNNSGWANLKVGNLTSVSSTVNGALSVTGATTLSSTLGVTGATTLTTATTGGLQATAIGNVTPGSGAFTSLSSSTTYTLNTGTVASLQATAIGNVTPGTGAFTTLTASGATTVTNSTASTSTSTGALVVTGGAGIGGALYAGTAYDNGNRVITGVTSSGAGNVTIGGSAPSLTVALTAIGPGAAQWGGITQLPYLSTDVYGRVISAGNIALNTVAVTNLGNTSEITANATVGLTGLSLTTTGVTAGNYGNASTIPTIVVDSKGRITSITTNAASTTFTIAGTSGSTDISATETLTLAGTYGVTVSVGDTYANISTPQDLRSTANPTFNNLTTASIQGVIGNVTPNTGAFTTATTGGLQAVAIGNVTPGTAAFTTATTGGLQATAIGNVTPGTGSFTTLTAQTETVGGLQAVAIGNVTPGTGSFTTLTAQTETVGGLQAVAIGNVTPGSGAFTTGTFSSTLGVTGATTMTTATTGGLQATAIGNVTPGTGSFTTLTAQTETVGGLQATAIGNVTPGTAAFTTATTGGLQATAIGNVTPGSGAFTTGTFSSTLGVTGATTMTTATVGGLQATAIGNVTPGSGAFTTTTTGGLQATAIGNVTPGSGAFTTTTTGGLQATAIGNVTPGTGSFTTLTAQTETVGGLQATAIGNVTPGTGAFTTLTASSDTTVTATTESTNTTTGALVVSGGVGVAKNLNVGGSVVITGNLTVQGDVTTVNAATLDVEDINITVAKGAASAAAANGGGLTVDGANATFTYANADDSWNVNKLLNINNSTGSTSTTTGALVVDGGAGIAQNLYVGGLIQAGTASFASINNTPIGNATPSTGSFTTLTAQTETVGGLQATAIGNVTPGTGAFTSLSSSTTYTLNTGTAASLQATAIGNVTPGTGSFTTLTAQTETVGGLQATAIGNVTPGTGAFTTATTGGLQATAIGNVTPGTGAFTSLSSSTTYVLNTGTAASLQATAIGNVTPGTGAFTTLTAQTETVGGLQATAIGNVTPGTGAFTSLSSSTTYVLNTGTAASLQATAIGNVTPGTGSFTTLTAQTETVGGLQATAIGNITPGTGSFTTLTAQTETVGGLQATAIGNVTPGTAAFTTTTTGGLQAVAIGNVTPGTAAFTSLSSSTTYALNTGTAASLQATAIGNVTPGTGAFTSLSSSTTYALNTGTAASLQATAIGNVTPGSGAFTTTTTGGLQATAIGNVTPGTGAFTTLSTTGVFTVGGNLVAAATTPSTTVSTGSLITKGGVGIDGNLNVGTYGTNFHSIRGNVLIGDGPANPTVLDSLLTLNENSSAPLTNSAFTIHVSAKDSRHGVVGVDTFGTGVTSSFIGRHSRGTADSPTAVQNNDIIGSIMFKGYGASAYAPGNGAGLYAISKENFTNSAMGTGIAIYTVPTGATTAEDVVYIGTDGNVVIKSDTPSVSDSTGALTVVGGAGIGGNLYVKNDIRTIDGSAFIGNAAFVTGIVRIASTQETTENGTGSFYTAGGASIAGNLHTGTKLYVGNSAFGLPMETPTIVAIDNGTQYAQVSMTNSSKFGSSDYSAYPSDYQGPSFDHGWADFGITGNSFSDPTYTITKSHDAYLFGSGFNGGGNLVLATDYTGTHNDILIGVGSFHANSEVVRFHGNALTSGTMVVKLPTNTTAANTGALQVWGGTSISGNVWLDNALTVNGSKTATNNVVFKGKTDETLLWSRAGSAYDQILIGGNASVGTLVRGAKLQVNSTDSILLPTGTTGERPSATGGTDTMGMFRYNTTLGAIEWYTGATWQTATTTFTVITDEQFNGDGATVNFNLGAATTTSSTIVSINGVVQIPTLAYSITGANNDVLTFTEAPANGDVIDVRRLVTTSTLVGVSSPNGKNAITTDNNGVYINTGSSTSIVTTSWNTSGYEISSVANVTVSTANTATTIATVDASLYRSGKFVIQATSGTDYQVMEALVIHDGTTASSMAYGVVQTNGNLGVVSATYSSGNVLLQFTASTSNTIVRVKTDLIKI